MKEQTVHLLKGAQNWEFQVLTKFKGTFGNQSLASGSILHKSAATIGITSAPWVLFPWAFHLPTSIQADTHRKLRHYYLVTSPKDAVGRQKPTWQ